MRGAGTWADTDTHLDKRRIGPLVMILSFHEEAEIFSAELSWQKCFLPIIYALLPENAPVLACPSCLKMFPAGRGGCAEGRSDGDSRARGDQLQPEL